MFATGIVSATLDEYSDNIVFHDQQFYGQANVQLYM